MKNSDFDSQWCRDQGVALPASFSKDEFWPILSALDHLELQKSQKGWTRDQQACSARIKEKVNDWMGQIKDKPSADLWAFKAGFSFYAGISKNQALSEANEAIKVSSNLHTVANYFKAISLSYKKEDEITRTLVDVTNSSDSHNFDKLLRRRAILLLKNRLSGGALYEASQKWIKKYPNDVEILLMHFYSSIDTKNLKDAQGTYNKLRELDLSQSEVSESLLRAELLMAESNYSDAALILSSIPTELRMSQAKKTRYETLLLRSLVKTNQWKRVREVVSRLLLVDPKNVEFQKNLDLAVLKGAIDSMNPIEDLEAVLKLNTDSFLIRYTLAKTLTEEFENGSRQDRAKMISRAETLASQLTLVNLQKIDVGYLLSRIYYLNKVYSKAENEITSVIKMTKDAKQVYQTTLVEIYDLAARISWSRGDWGEAKRLAREGISRVKLRSEKLQLNQLLAQIP